MDWSAWRENTFDILFSASSIIRAHPEVSNLFVVRNARVPVVRFVDTPTGLHCDLTCHNNLGINNSLLLRSLVNVVPSLIRPFLSFLKIWAKHHHMIGGSLDGTLSSYAMNLLGIFYLQQLNPPLLPTIASLQKDIPPKMCRDWNSAFTEPVPVIQHSAVEIPNLMQLLTGFFQFIQSLDAANIVLCPLLGHSLPLSHFQSTEETISPLLQELMPLYVENISVRKLQALRPNQLNLQDPFELNHNVSFGFKQMAQFKDLCQESVCLCSPEITSLSSLFGDPPKRVASPSHLKYKASIKIQFEATTPDVTKELYRQVLDASAHFIGKLLSYSYGLTVTPCSSEVPTGASESKKLKTDDQEPPLNDSEDMLMKWHKFYNLQFPYNVFHPLREQLAEEIWSREDDGKSLLDRERQITSLLSTKQLDDDGGDDAFPPPGAVIVKCQLSKLPKGVLIFNLENKRKALLKPPIFQKLVQGLGSHVIPSLQRFISQNLFPFVVRLIPLPPHE